MFFNPPTGAMSAGDIERLNPHDHCISNDHEI